MNTAKPFKEYFEASFQSEADQKQAMLLSRHFFTDFLHCTPLEIDSLMTYLNDGHVDMFYKSLLNLKYLVEYSDNLNRYWYLLRAYSGALAKLKADQTVKGSKKLYLYYFEKYGDRRILRNEHWFEKKRWEFLDELQAVYTEKDLSNFIKKYYLILFDTMKTYSFYLSVFMKDLKQLQPETASLV